MEEIIFKLSVCVCLLFLSQQVVISLFFHPKHVLFPAMEINLASVYSGTQMWSNFWGATYYFSCLCNDPCSSTEGRHKNLQNKNGVFTTALLLWRKREDERKVIFLESFPLNPSRLVLSWGENVVLWGWSLYKGFVLTI